MSQPAEGMPEVGGLEGLGRTMGEDLAAAGGIVISPRFGVLRSPISRCPDAIEWQAIEWRGNTFDATNCINIYRILTIFCHLIAGSFQGLQRGIKIVKIR